MEPLGFMGHKMCVRVQSKWTPGYFCQQLMEKLSESNQIETILIRPEMPFANVISREVYLK
jgi:hypothetical protein